MNPYGGKEHEKIVLPKFYNEQGENIYMNLIILHTEVKKLTNFFFYCRTTLKNK